MSLRWKVALALASLAVVATLAIGTVSYRSTRDRLLSEVDRSLLELERQMRLSEDVIRFLTIKLDEVNEAPSPMMSRRDRDDRRRRDDRPREDRPRDDAKSEEKSDAPAAEAAPAEETA